MKLNGIEKLVAGRHRFWRKHHVDSHQPFDMTRYETGADITRSKQKKKPTGLAGCMRFVLTMWKCPGGKSP